MSGKRDPLLAVDEARELVAATVPAALPSEGVPVEDALGRVLAEDVTAHTDVPSFPNSAMDGFAVAAGPAGQTVRIVDESRAGRPAQRALGEDEAIRISTGALVPRNATSVVPVEHTREHDGQVELLREAAPQANIRDPGEDMRAGRLALPAGTVLGPAELGLAVAAGRASLSCARRPRVAVLTTGDELAPPGAPLAPGEIHNSNGVALTALAARDGAEVTGPAGIVRDDRPGTERALGAALDEADVVLVSGGVSVGPHDHVKPVLEELGVRERFWRVALKPGKPVWFGSREAKLVFGLPGNPVSAAVCFVLFARPGLRALQGAAPFPARGTARLAEPVLRSPDRVQAVRVTLEPGGEGTLDARPTGPQGSHMLTSLVGAQALALIPSGEGSVPVGAVVALEPM